MIKLWNVKVKIQGERRPLPTIGIEEDNHQLIVWKYWVNFSPEYSFFHSRILKNDYGLMETLLRVGTYYQTETREDKSKVYASSIIGISPYMLSFLSGYDRHTIPVKLQELAKAGYISYTPPSRGNKPEMDIILNQYTPENMRIFTLEKAWIDGSLTVEKGKAIMQSEDRKNFTILNDMETLSMVGGMPIPAMSLVGILPKKAIARLVENVPLDMTKFLSGEQKITPEMLMTDSEKFEGIAKQLVESVNNIIQVKDNTKAASLGPSGPDYSHSLLRDYARNQGEPAENTADSTNSKNLPNRKKSEPADIDSLSTWGQVVAVFYEKETKLKLTKVDVEWLDKVLQISSPNQVISAIKSAKVWRAGYPNNFNRMSDKEKHRCLIESQPGYYLKRDGLKHVYNFVSKSPRYRKDRRRMKSTGVVSGLDEQRASNKQKKIMEEIRKKRKAKEQGGEQK